MTDLLVAERVRKEFGGLVATNDIDFTIPQGSIVSLIGPNGAGKTTFFNMLTGVYKPTDGKIVFDGVDVSDKPPHAITALGDGEVDVVDRDQPAELLADGLDGQELRGQCEIP